MSISGAKDCAVANFNVRSDSRSVVRISQQRRPNTTRGPQFFIYNIGCSLCSNWRPKHEMPKHRFQIWGRAPLAPRIVTALSDLFKIETCSCLSKRTVVCSGSSKGAWVGHRPQFLSGPCLHPQFVNGQWFIVSYDSATNRSTIKAIACSKPTISEH